MTRHPDTKYGRLHYEAGCIEERSKLGLNVGSGQRRFESTGDWRWVNIDCVSRPPDQVPDIVCDVGNEPLPFPEATVDCVVLHHILEHFGCNEADPMLNEAWRVLKPSGRLIVSVPDMFMLARGWLQGKIDTETYMINVYGAYQGEEGDRHKWGFTANSLRKYLGKWGKAERVIQPDERIPPGADVAFSWWILVMRCTKSS